MNAECEATGLGLHFVCTLGAMMTEYVYYIDLYVLFTIEVAISYFLLLYFIALQNITNRGAPNQFPPPLRHNPCSAPAPLQECSRGVCAPKTHACAVHLVM